MHSPFLTIYTPTYKRPRMLKQAIESVDRQTMRRQIKHVIDEDNSQEGIAGMYRRYRAAIPSFRGEYAFFLQDDDVLEAPDSVEQVYQFAKEHNNPPVIIVRNTKGFHGLLPKNWRQPPRLGEIDFANWIVRQDVHKQMAMHYGECYEGDYAFIKAVWDAGYEFEWFDYLFSHATQIGFGKPEEEEI